MMRIQRFPATLMVVLALGYTGASASSHVPAATIVEFANGACGAGSASGVDDSLAEYVSVDGLISNAAGSCQAVASVTTSGGFSPQIDLLGQANATVGTFPSGSEASANARIDYSLVLNGPPDQEVFVWITAYIDITGGATGAGGSAQGRGEIIGLPIPFNSSVSVCSYFGLPGPICPSGPGSGADWQIGTQTVLRTGQLYNFTLRGAGRAVASPIGMDSSAAADFQVIVDPVFSFVNPEDAALYSFEFSPNLAAVPAPASVWLLGSALPFLGWYRQRQRRPGRAASPVASSQPASG